MAYVRTLKNGTHQVRWGRGKDQSRTFPAGKRGAKEADAFRIEVEIALRRGESVPRPQGEVVATKLEDAFDRYVDHCRDVLRLADRSGEAVAHSLNVFMEFLRAKVRPRGVLHLDVLTEENIERFYVWMRREREWQKRVGMGEGVSRQRATKVADAWRWIHRRHRTETPAPVALELPRVRIDLRPRRHTWEECDRVIEQATIGWHRRLMIACRFTGLRKMQVMRLLGSDFDVRDPDNATLLIRPELGKSEAEKMGRRVPIAPAFAREVSTWGLDAGYAIKVDTRQGLKRGKRTIAYEYFRTYWKDATGERPRQPFHGFRKAFEQELRRARVRDDVRDLLVGHAQGLRRGSGTDATYLGEDPLMPEAREAVQRIPALGAAGSLDNVVAIKRKTTLRRSR